MTVGKNNTWKEGKGDLNLGKTLKSKKNGGGEEYQVAGNFTHPCCAEPPTDEAGPATNECETKPEPSSESKPEAGSIATAESNPDENKTEAETDDNKSKAETDENKSKIETEENKSKAETEENMSKAETEQEPSKPEAERSSSNPIGRNLQLRRKKIQIK